MLGIDHADDGGPHTRCPGQALNGDAMISAMRQSFSGASAEHGFYCARTGLRFQWAVARVNDALKVEGFGVPTDMAVRATMQAKLNADVPAHHILGAGNPPLARRAVTAQPAVCVCGHRTAVLCRGQPQAIGGKHLGRRPVLGAVCARLVASPGGAG